MAIAEELQIIVDAKVSQAVKDMKKVTQSIEGTTKTTNKLAASFKTLAGPVAIGAVLFGLGRMTKELIKSASDAEETRNKFNVVFASVADDAKEAADRIKDEFKLSDSTTEKFLSQVGDITSGLGATSAEALNAAEQITALGLDIDSFANLSGGAEQAVKALTSLFTGEREAAKALGIVINDTNLKAYAEDMGKVFKELTPLEKGFLSLELATTQSKLAIGDFARSSDSYANTMKAAKESTNDLKVVIGESLLPTATTIVGTFGRLTGALADFINEANNLEEARKASTEGVATVDQRILTLNAENLELQVELNKKISGRAAIIKDGIQLSEDTKKIYQEQIDLIQNQIIANNRLIGGIELRKVLQGEAAKAAEAEAQAELDRTATQESAESLLADRILSRRSATEVEIALLNEQIDQWVQFREIVGVQELLNDLIAERNELLKEDVKILDEVINTELENLLKAAEARANAETAYIEVVQLTQDEVTAIEEEASAARIALAQEELDAKIAMGFEYANAAMGFLTAIDSLSNSVAANELQRMEEEGASQEQLDAKKRAIARNAAIRKKALGVLSVGIDTASAIIGMLADPGGIPGIVLSALAGATGAAQLGAVLAAPIPALAQGGSFVTNGPMPVMVGDNIGGQERVTVEPVSSRGANVDYGGGGGTYILSIDGEQFNSFMQQKVDNGALHSSAGGRI